MLAYFVNQGPLLMMISPMLGTNEVTWCTSFSLIDSSIQERLLYRRPCLCSTSLIYVRGRRSRGQHVSSKQYSNVSNISNNQSGSLQFAVLSSIQHAQDNHLNS